MLMGVEKVKIQVWVQKLSVDVSDYCCVLCFLAVCSHAYLSALSMRSFYLHPQPFRAMVCPSSCNMCISEAEAAPKRAKPNPPGAPGGKAKPQPTPSTTHPRSKVQAEKKRRELGPWSPRNQSVHWKSQWRATQLAEHRETSGG